MMSIEEVRAYCLSKVGVTEDAAFGPETVLFRLCHKIFACLDLSRPNLVVLKADEAECIDLRERFAGINGAWHWNKRYWNDVLLDADVDEALVRELIDHSYDLIRRGLPKKTLYNFPDLPANWQHLHFPVLDSAMTLVKNKKQGDPGSEFFLVTADFQTAGRGQGKNTWESAKGENLLMAMRFHPCQVKAVDQFSLLECISVAVALTLEKYCKGKVRIKWPNDIYCDDHKICGILIEHDLCGDQLLETRCGIGLNVNQKVFESDAPNPVSISQTVGHDVDRAAVLRNFIRYFIQLYGKLINRDEALIRKEYMKRLYRLSGWYPFRDENGVFEAHLYDVAADGCLLLMDKNKNIRKYAHKEVEYVLSKKEYVPSPDEEKTWSILSHE